MKDLLIKTYLYEGCRFILTTKHSKSLAVAPPFKTLLKADVIEHVVDTDLLGTFSGEIKRKISALESAKKKCEWSLQKQGEEVLFALASEGSFGPHPYIPFAACDQEILYFIDNNRKFHLHVSHISTKTNYRAESLDSWDQLEKFAEEVVFPSHALILKPNINKKSSSIFKGLTTKEALKEAFYESKKHSEDKRVWVETDMRAHLNPTRMSVIGELAQKLASRLATNCPTCHLPGWGMTRVEKGLECDYCGAETELVKYEVFGCVKCDHEEFKPRLDGLTKANPRNCYYCNP